jgi:O-antigen/teichoic acid export membrane protein
MTGPPHEPDGEATAGKGARRTENQEAPDRFTLGRGTPVGFFRNIAWQYLSSLGGAFISFAYALIVGRLLGVADFGLMALALGFSSVVFQFVELRLHEAVIRYASEFWESDDHPRLVATVKLSLALDGLTAVLALLLTWGLAAWGERTIIRDPKGAEVILLAAAATFFMRVGTASAQGVLRVLRLYRLQAVVTLGGAILKLTVTVTGMALLGWGVRGVLVAAMLAHCVTSLALVTLVLSRLHRQVNLRRPGAGLRLLQPRLQEMKRFVVNTYLLSVSMVPTKDLDVNLLGWLATLEVVGLYKIAKSFVAALWTLSDATFVVVYPELARLWAQRRVADIRAFVKRMTVVFGVGGVAAYLCAFALVPPVIRVVMGAEFSGAGPLFRWMAWGIMFWAPLVWINPLLMAAGRPDLTLRASLVGSIVTLLLFVIGIAEWGGTGAAAVYALASPVVIGLVIWFGRSSEAFVALRSAPAAVGWPR